MQRLLETINSISIITAHRESILSLLSNDQAFKLMSLGPRLFTTSFFIGNRDERTFITTREHLSTGCVINHNWQLFQFLHGSSWLINIPCSRRMWTAAPLVPALISRLFPLEHLVLVSWKIAAEIQEISPAAQFSQFPNRQICAVSRQGGWLMTLGREHKSFEFEFRLWSLGNLTKRFCFRLAMETLWSQPFRRRPPRLIMRFQGFTRSFVHEMLNR